MYLENKYAEYRKNWYLANKKRILSEKKVYYAKHKKQILIKNKFYRTENPDKYRDSVLKRTYGISLKEYNILLKKQKNKCYLCDLDGKKQIKKLHVDHDHKTGKIRKLLCNNCNRGLGLLKDDISILKRSIKYIKDHR